MADAAAHLRASGARTTKILNEGDHIHVSYPAQGNMPQTISDDDLLKALTSPTPASASSKTLAPTAGYFPPGDSRNGPAAMTVSPSPTTGTKQLSDEQLLAALTGSAGKAAPPPGNPPPAASPPPAVASPNGLPKRFDDNVGITGSLHMPFLQDVLAGGAALEDKAGNVLSGRGGPSLGDSYRARMDELKQRQKEFEAKYPRFKDYGWTLGAVPAFEGSAAEVAAQGTKLGLKAIMKEGAKTGGLFGAVAGLGTPGDHDGVAARLENALIYGGLGTGLGVSLPATAAGLSYVGQKAGNVARRVFPSVKDAAFNKAKAIIDDFAGGSVTPAAHEIIPGSKPTLAESVTNPGISLLQKQMTQLNPNSPLLERTAQNAAARVAHLENSIGSEADIKVAEKARDKITGPQKNAVFNPATIKPVDISPVNAAIETVLSGKRGGRPAVLDAMNEVKTIIKNANTSDPERLYESVRTGINDLIQGKDLNKQYGKVAASELMDVRKALDAAIETGAPGFKKYLSDYDKASSPIDAMRYLQGLRLTDDLGKIQLSKVNAAIRGLKLQREAAGIKAAKHVSDPQMKALTDLKDDLVRSKNLELGKPSGADTRQNFNLSARLGLDQAEPGFFARNAPKVTGSAIGATIGHLTGVPLGEGAGAYIGGTIANEMSLAQARKANVFKGLVKDHLENMLLNPGATQSIPMHPVAPLNDILNSARARTALGVTNRLAVMHELGSNKRANGR
jgi:hypothetical protein